MHLLGGLVQQHFSLDLENKKWLYCRRISSSCTHHWCFLACGMAAFSKEQFWHISPAGFYQIKEFSPLPPVSSKSGWEKPRIIREMLKTKLNQNIISQNSEKSTWRSLIVENRRLMPGSYQQGHVPAVPGWIQLPNGAEPINMGDFHSMEFKGIFISRF